MFRRAYGRVPPQEYRARRFDVSSVERLSPRQFSNASFWCALSLKIRSRWLSCAFSQAVTATVDARSRVRATAPHERPRVKTAGELFGPPLGQIVVLLPGH